MSQRKKKKQDEILIIRNEDIKIRKTGARPGQAHKDKKKYDRKKEKSCNNGEGQSAPPQFFIAN